MLRKKTHKRILGIEINDRSEAVAIIGVMILFASLAVIIAIAINLQAF